MCLSLSYMVHSFLLAVETVLLEIRLLFGAYPCWPSLVKTEDHISFSLPSNFATLTCHHAPLVYSDISRRFKLYLHGSDAILSIIPKVLYTLTHF